MLNPLLFHFLLTDKMYFSVHAISYGSLKIIIETFTSIYSTSLLSPTSFQTALTAHIKKVI